MKRLQADEHWTLFDPHEVKSLYGKNLQDDFGDELRPSILSSKRMIGSR